MKSFIGFVFLIFFHTSYAFDSFLQSSNYNAVAGTGIANTVESPDEFGLINPALIATKASLIFSGGYAAGDYGGSDYESLSARILDSTNGAWDSRQGGYTGLGGEFPVASMLSYSKIKQEAYQDQYFHLAIAQPIGSKMAIGIYGNYSLLESKIFSVDDEFFDLGAGFIWKLHRKFSLGLSATNLLDRRHEEIPGYLRRAIGLGTELKVTPQVALRFDYWSTRDQNNKASSIYRFGVSNFVTEAFALRFGFAKDELFDTNVISAGFGVIGPRLSLAYAFQRQTSLGSELHSIDLQLPLW